MSEPKIAVVKDANYKTIVVSGMFGGRRPGFFEAIVYSDELVADEAVNSMTLNPEKASIKRTLQCRLYFDPITAKSILSWLNDHIAKYEGEFGKIPIPGKEAKLPSGAPYS